MNGFGAAQPVDRPARRIADEEDEEEVGSNPDELVDETVSQPEEEGEGEDLNDNWLRYVECMSPLRGLIVCPQRLCRCTGA